MGSTSDTRRSTSRDSSDRFFGTKTCKRSKNSGVDGPSARLERLWRCSNPRQKGPCRSQSELATNAAEGKRESVEGDKRVSAK
ncbi:hypothetical protein PoB_000814400 [Plakobranchus ocellatus]|uniref:Uncharacterized protein n=1 Tax=Plakobranchus ocellatus TaxID=259542 RepID=A0AAV3YI31_9GAST|nr:hypothetical protein PoB_000814400 [Plakobranchus ocellatus]